MSRHDESMLDFVLSDVEDPQESAALRDAWVQLGVLEMGKQPEVAPTQSPWARRLTAIAATLIVGLSIGIFVLVRDDHKPFYEGYVLIDEPFQLPEDRVLASHRLAAIEQLSTSKPNPHVLEQLVRAAAADPSIDVQLRAIDAIEAYSDDPRIPQVLIWIARESDSTLVRVRLLELFVDQRMSAALPEIQSLEQSPTTDEIVRDSARWAIERLSS